MPSPTNSVKTKVEHFIQSCAIWFVFSFFVGIIPLIIICFFGKSPVQWGDFVEKGTLAIVCIGITGSAIGRISDSLATPQVLKNLALVSGSAFLLLLSFLFASVYFSDPMGNIPMVNESWVFFLCSCGGSFICLMIAVVFEALK
jgi:uncharacterized membrane protein YdcZ (DUF606 family)